MGGPFDFGEVADQTQPHSRKLPRWRQCGGRRQSASASLSCYWHVNSKKWLSNKETHNFLCLEGYLLQTKSNMLCWLVCIDVAPFVVSQMLHALQISVQHFKLGIICKVSFASAFSSCLMTGQVQSSRAASVISMKQWYCPHMYQMLNLQKNWLPTASTLHHFQNSNKCLIDISSRGKTLSSSMISNIACLPSQLISLMVEIHLGIDVVEKVIVRNVCWDWKVLNDILANRYTHSDSPVSYATQKINVSLKSLGKYYY